MQPSSCSQEASQCCPLSENVLFILAEFTSQHRSPSDLNRLKGFAASSSQRNVPFVNISDSKNWLSKLPLTPNLKFWLGFYFLCRGIIVLENKTFVIEPASGRDNETHFIYRVENLKLTQGDCGHGFNMTSVPLENHIKYPFQSFHTRVRAALSAFNKLDFIALLLAVETEFHCSTVVRLGFDVGFFLWLIKILGTWPNAVNPASLPGWIPSQRALDFTHFICT